MPILTLPNCLTIARCAIVPALVALHFVAGDIAHWVSVALVAAAGITDYLDGHLARLMDKQSEFGRFLDPIADKLLVVACLMLLVADGTITGAAVVAAVVILLREILISGLREFMSGREMVVLVTPLAKWKTTVQIVAVAFLLGAPVEPSWLPAWLIGTILLWIAAALTAVTGWDYLRAGFTAMKHGSTPKRTDSSSEKAAGKQAESVG